MARRSRTARLDRWRKSAEFRQIASQSARANLENFKTAPRCGAKRKRDGQPCEKPAMAGKQRCRNHGGATPSGKAWHVPQYADPSTPRGERKLNRKLRAMRRYAEKRAERLAAMTLDARTRHETWQKTHKPGAEATRCAERDRRRQSAEVRALIDGEPSQRPTDPEWTRIETALSAAKARLAVLEARNDDERIFLMTDLDDHKRTNESGGGVRSGDAPEAAEDIRRRARHRLQTEGFEVGVRVLIELAEDAKQKGSTRGAAAKSLVQSGSTVQSFSPEELAEMSGEQIRVLLAEAERALAARLAKLKTIEHVPTALESPQPARLEVAKNAAPTGGLFD